MSLKIRMLVIVPRYGTINRGVETFAKELISRLDLRKYEITVLSRWHTENLEGIHFVSSPTILRETLSIIDRYPKIMRFLRWIGLGSSSDIEALTLCWNARNEFKGESFDIVLPMGGTWTYRFARFRFPKSIIVSIGQAGPVKRDLQYSDYFVALTPFDETQANLINPKIKTTVIPNGVDFQRFSPNTKSSVDVVINANKIKTILIAAAFVEDKRHDLLFNAVSLLSENVHVICVGDGPNRDVLEKHPLALAGRVSFKHVSYKDMPDIYRGADIFSLPSPNEAFGIVFIEAMAAGLPVVAYNGPRQEYVVGLGGVLCNVFDAKIYASALEKSFDLQRNPLLNSHMSKFDWNEVAQRYNKMFSSFFN